MTVISPTDADLLAAHRRGAGDAFGQLVGRYVGLVYSACLRQLGDKHLAEDATQAVFILLNQKSRGLSEARISGWLLTTARYACANIRKAESRRKRREEVAILLTKQTHKEAAMGSDDGDAAGIRAILDEALCRLGAADREALVRRYLQEESLRQVGAALGVSEEAARKRVERGLDKLRALLARRGVTAAGGAIAVALAAEAGTAHAAGASALAVTITQVCHGGAATAASVSVAQGVQTMMTLAKIKIAAAIAAAAVVLTASGWVIAQVAAPAPSPAATAKIAIVPAAGAGAPIARTTAPAPVPATAASTRPALDLSSPERTFETLHEAVVAGDRARTYACLTSDPNRAATPVDGLIGESLAENRLLAACRKRFGPRAEQARLIFTMDQAMDVLRGGSPAGVPTKVDGDKAAMWVQFPEVMIQLINTQYPGVGADMRAWNGHALYFVRQNGQWKMDLENSFYVVLNLWAVTDHAIDEPELKIGAVIDFTKGIDDVTATVEAGGVANMDEVVALWQQHNEGVMRQYKAQWMDMRVLPRGIAATQTQPQ